MSSLFAVSWPGHHTDEAIILGVLTAEVPPNHSRETNPKNIPLTFSRVDVSRCGRRVDIQIFSWTFLPGFGYVIKVQVRVSVIQRSDSADSSE